MISRLQVSFFAAVLVIAVPWAVLAQPQKRQPGGHPTTTPKAAPPGTQPTAPKTEPGPSPVMPEDERIRVTPFDLADAASKPSTPGKCVLKGTVVLGDCAKLAQVTSSTRFDNVIVDIEDATTRRGTFTRSGDSITITTSPVMAAIAFSSAPSGWGAVALTNGVTKDPRALQAFGVNQPRGIYGRDEDGNLYELTLSSTKPAGGSDQSCVSDSVSDWCKAAKNDDDLICVDATNGFDPVTFGPKKHILKPNSSVSVVVRHLVNQGVEIKQLGQRGLFESSVADYTGKFYKQDIQHDEGTTCAMASHGSFAPRLPGSADIKIELRDVNDRTKLIADHTIELEVVTTYAGAIRLGFSTVMGDAVNRGYASQLAPGSSTREIVATETGDVNTEVVVGISAYLYDIVKDGGRKYVDRSVLSYVVPSPYLGIGVASWKGSGLSSIPSVHFGLEWEVSKSFAFSLDALARKVTRLSDGYFVGSPVSAMTTFTTDRYEWGWAFTVSVSPEFLQFAVGSP